MNMNEIRKFEVDPSKKDCKIPVNPFLNGAEYYVRKELRDENTFFFASMDERYIVDNNDLESQRYRFQIGFTNCSRGVIELTMVNGPIHKINARNCGLGTVFASLCMSDPDLDMLPIQRIDEEFSDDARTAKIIKKSCSKFMGLLMLSNDLGGPYKNFNAALKNGYNKFLIKTKNIIGKKERYHWMDTVRAKECYNDDTGNFGDGIEGYANNWWFCKEIPGKFPKFPSLNICGDKPKF